MEQSVIKVGKRKERSISLHASGEAFVEGARFNESLQSLPTGNQTFIPKGLYFFKTNQEADSHRETCLIQGMAQVAASRK
jgi:hypothetical protein